MSYSPAASEVFERVARRSEDGLAAMRLMASEMFGNDKSIIVGVNGSYARREVTQGSDVDLFFIFYSDDVEDVRAKQSKFRARLELHGFKMPAIGGVFEQPLSAASLVETIGGQNDDNDQITRRMLLLLEGEWIHNVEKFGELREKLLNQYVSPQIKESQICLFLLNDIIRFWRTMCVDFEYKSQKENKPREIRLIKLRFSRMMLFFAGVLAVGETHQIPHKEKIRKLGSLLAIPAWRRVDEIAKAHAQPVLDLYAEFLERLDDDTVRRELSKTYPAGSSSQAFEELRNRAKDFRKCLLELLHAQCKDPNPIIPALIL